MPLAIDLFCGLGGWTEGLLAEGYYVVGFDIEQHVYGNHRYPANLVLQDVLTIHGSQFKDAALIVASPPCQAYSYRAMPWKRAKALPPPDNSLFEACFRIQREAIEATKIVCPNCEGRGNNGGLYPHSCAHCNGKGYLTRHIPMVVENVCGAQKWVGRARWHHGSFYLWGDVPALMPIVRLARKNTGGSWFSIAHNTISGKGKNPDGRNDPRDSAVGSPPFPEVEAAGGASNRPAVNDWRDNPMRQGHSRSPKRKAASAMIAKIPFALSSHIARVYRP